MKETIFKYFFIKFAPTTLLLLILALPNGAMAGETDTEMPMGSVGGEVRADLFTGTATTSIPISVPPGRQGVQPQLALVYGSANGNGWVGMGWKLEKSVVDRRTKFGLDYNGDDYTFRLSGINVDLVSVGTGEFRAKIEGSFTRVKKLTAADGKPYFEATDKSGKKHYFGQTAQTRVADPSDANRIFRWCLDRVEDVHGNYMTITYSGSQGTAYLSRIDYTGNSVTGKLPTHSVLFYTEDRTDDIPLYFTHFETRVDKRLKTVEVRANGSLIRAYQLTYTSSSNSGRSLLFQVKQYGKNASVDSNGNITVASNATSIHQENAFAFNQYFPSTVTRFELSKLEDSSLALADINFLLAAFKN